jgi:hypothetical protein
MKCYFKFKYWKICNKISEASTKLYLFTGEKGPLLLQILHRALNQNVESSSAKKVMDINRCVYAVASCRRLLLFNI